MNTHPRYTLLLSALLAIAGFGQIAPAQSVPEGGVSVVGDVDLVESMNFRAGSSNGQPIAVRTVVDVEGQSFDQAVRIAVNNPGTNFWDSALSKDATVAVAKGDVGLFHAYIRKIESLDESGLVSMQVYVEGDASYSYSKSLSTAISAGDEWTELFLPFVFNDDYPSGTLTLNLGFGQTGKTMTMEIGGVELLTYGTTKTLEEMPRTAITYAGRELDAPWRAEAAARIENIRKGDLEIRVLDDQGYPVPGASVEVEMLRHHFKFSTAVTAELLTQDSADAAIYREKILELFNAVGTENDLKWPPWDGEWGSNYNKAQTLNALQWIQENDLFVRGHVLVWPGERNLPNSIKPLLVARDESVPQRVLNHIDDITQATKDYVQEWDVLNEPYDNRDLMDVYGDTVMVDWFEQARTNLPEADLYINDYSILSSRGRDTAHQDRLEDVVQYLVDNDAPITGIGFQGHFGDAPTEPTKLWEVLERYGNAFPELKFKVTEFDVNTIDLEYQADYTRDFMTLVFSHPQMEGFQFWGFWAGRHWREEASMFNEDWTEKPFAAVYRDLVFNQWWQEPFAGSASQDGTFNGTTYYGTHRVTVTLDGKSQSTDIEFVPGSRTVKVRLSENPNPTEPVILTQPQSLRTKPGETARFEIEAIGNPAPTFNWFRNGTKLRETGPSIEIRRTGAEDSGIYRVDVTNSHGTVSSRDFVLAVKEPPYDQERLVNISTRGQVQKDDAIMIAGFVLRGTESKEVLLRAIGPALGSFGVDGTLTDPILELFQVSASQTEPMARNEAWEIGNDSELIQTISTRVGAFPLEAGSRDAVLYRVLEPGAYTAQVSGPGVSTGVGLVEVYDADTVTSGLPSLGEVANISTRGVVGTGSAIIIAGFVVTGEVPKPVLIRGIGQTLEDFGVAGTLPDPQITVFKKVPDSSDVVVARNDDWNDQSDAAAIREAAATTGAFPLAEGNLDAALLLWLEPGAYTAQVSGSGGDTGVALVEVYAVD